MDDELATKVKEQLDAQLANAAPNVGIAFGLDLFDAFRDRKWITLNTFGALGTSFGATKLPAYGSHYAFPTWDLPENEFKVGEEQDP
ncbi:hypothetical protein [Bradyrhizobium sp. HKCCYLRH3097]|uniref:hypothetical protein n=1 Tax=Bradyrhizobium sp. HKCCYLRH3097 TaxID=3420752 RepID=UPI003EBDCB3A